MQCTITNQDVEDADVAFVIRANARNDNIDNNNNNNNNKTTLSYYEQSLTKKKKGRISLGTD